jgi:hypothetical protein
MMDFLIAASALAAALFWFISATVSLPSRGTQWYQTGLDDPYTKAMKRVARLNAIAAAFTGLSALLAFVKAVWFVSPH